MRIFVTALLASGLLSAPALGNDIKSAVKAFGLMGTWSPDCSKEISQPRASRLAFAVPLAGGTTATVQDNHDEGVVTTVYEIVESTISESDKIRIVLHPVTITKPDGKAGSQHDYDNLHLVFQKVGERIEIIRIQFEDLPEIERAIFFEKCSN